jgi:DUF1680 family protein
MLAWRLLLATGEPQYADLIERTMFNGVLAGIGLEGYAFFYVNPLQRRTERVPAERDPDERQAWYACACCPPNLMRTISTWQQMLATTDEQGVQVHQYASADVRADVGGSEVRLGIETNYPWDGIVTVEVLETPDRPWTLTLRRPAWAGSATVAWPRDRDGPGDGRTPEGSESPDRRFERTIAWRKGDRVVLDLAVTPRVTEPDARIDAVRGSVALERGPLVYAVETVDLPAGVEVEGLAIDPSHPVVDRPRPEVSEGAVGLQAQGVYHRPDDAGWPYKPAIPGAAVDSADAAEPSDERTQIDAVPYFAWANRGPGGMRVWIPRAGQDSGSGAAH